MAKPKKILYVEDDRDIAESVKIILKVLNCDVKIAYNGKSGLELLKKEDFDLVILDTMLPDISGFEVFDKALKYANKKTCRFVFLSITNIPKSKKEELTLKGAKDYIPKPFKKEELIRRISMALEDQHQKKKNANA